MEYLCFPDEKTAQKLTGWWNKKNGWVKPTPLLQIAVRGVIYNDNAEFDAEGNLIREPTPQPGFHIDVLYGVIPEIAQQYIVTPSDPDFVLA